MKTYNLINITILLLSFLFFPSAFSQQLANNKKNRIEKCF
jgi:hypothetical protein